VKERDRLNPLPPESSLVDTHCHLEMEAFAPDRELVIERALDAGIDAMITIGSDLEGNIGGLELSRRYDEVFTAVGYHPHDAKDFTDAVFRQIREWAVLYRYQRPNVGSREPRSPTVSSMRAERRHRSVDSAVEGRTAGAGSPPTEEREARNAKVVAIGEIGLDYHYDNSPRATQRDVFAKQLDLARSLELPAIIHSREAKKDTLDILEASGCTRGVFHCFSGDIDMAERAMALGFHISLAGPVTFKNARKPKEIARAIPDHRLLIETDAPYLAPEPFRGRRNEPAYLVHIARVIAELRGITLDDVARITTLNARRLFGIGEIPDKGKIAYRIRDSLYLNITNRCTNRCSFCVRFQSDYVKGHKLTLATEPTEEEVKDAIGDPSRYREIVFCGFGEPLIRLELVKRIARWVKRKGGTVRIDTNGHGNLIHGRNIVPELAGLVDSISVSLNAQDGALYDALCRPLFENAYEGVLSFIREAKKVIPRVHVTVVALPGVDIERCREIAAELDVELRVRERDVVG